MKRAYLLPLLLLSPLACHDDSGSGVSYPSRHVLPIVALDDRVAYVDDNSGLAFLLNPAETALRPRLVPTGKAPIVAEKRKGANNQLLVLTRGEPGSVGTEPEPAKLVLIDPASAKPVGYDLPGRFDQLDQSDDGRFALLSYGSASSGASGSMLYNPNDLAVVWLDGSQPLASRPIRSLGSAPIGVTFSPRATLFGQERTLAVIWALNYVTLLDLDNPSHSEITIPLVPDGKYSVTPLQVLFDMSGPVIYVRADGSSDIFQVSLAQGAPADQPANSTSNDFHVSLSLLGSGSTPSDMVTFDPGNGTGTRLAITAPGTRQLVILDPQTGNATSVPTGAQVNRILKFHGVRPGSSDPQVQEDQALLLGVGNGETSKSRRRGDWPSRAGLCLLPFPTSRSFQETSSFSLRSLAMAAQPSPSSS